MKKVLLLAAFGVGGIMSAQSFQQTSISNGNVTYKYTSTCGVTTNITVVGGELTFSENLIIANIENKKLCKTIVSSIQIKSTSLE